MDLPLPHMHIILIPSITVYSIILYYNIELSKPLTWSCAYFSVEKQFSERFPWKIKHTFLTPYWSSESDTKITSDWNKLQIHCVPDSFAFPCTTCQLVPTLFNNTFANSRNIAKVVNGVETATRLWTEIVSTIVQITILNAQRGKNIHFSS